MPEQEEEKVTNEAPMDPLLRFVLQTVPELPLELGWVETCPTEAVPESLY